MVYIASADDLRDYLGVDETVMPDAEATILIDKVEICIDQVLGWRPVDATTGLKIVEEDVEAWQWTHLQRAALLAAKNIYDNPVLSTPITANSESSPDFSRSGIMAAAQSPENMIGVFALQSIAASGLRVLSC